MPFIHIRSLPFRRSIDVRAVLEGVSADFAAATGVGLEHVHATWEFLRAHHHAAGGKAAGRQPRSSHPLLVDLLTPSFNRGRAVERMLECLAASLERRVRLPPTNIFINHRHAQSGMVYDGGRVVRW